MVTIPPPPPPPPGVPSISNAAGTLTHGSSVTITGSGFGTKTTAAPVIWDDASIGSVPTDNGKWDGYYPQYPVHSTVWHVRYTSPIRGVATAHTHVARYMAGGHGEVGSNGYDVMFWKNRTMASYPQFTYACWYERGDPNWVFGGDNNYKMYDFSTGTQPYASPSNWYTAWNTPLPNSTVGGCVWVFNDDCLDAPCESLAWPDNNGHNYYWNTGANNFGGWQKVEMEIQWTNQTSGYVKVWNNGVLVMNYSGPTDKYAGTARSESVGGYARMYGQPNNWRYWNDVYLDYTRSRVLLANNATLTSATIREIQIPSSWSNGSINATMNLGKFTTGQTAYLFVLDSTGVSNTTGFPVVVG